MNKLLNKPLATLAVAVLATPAAAAEIEGNVTLATDYSFRGWSQTMRDPAIQGGFDVTFDSGLYIGTWGSNVNFGASDDGKTASMELDLYIGWSGDLSDDVSVDVSFIHFDYPGDRSNLNYQEIAASLSFGDVTLGINYSPEYLATDDVTFFYPYAQYSYGLAENVSLDFHVGFNRASSPTEDFFGANQGDDYVDYSAAISFPVAKATVSFGIFGTNNDYCGGSERDCKARPILSLSL